MEIFRLKMAMLAFAFLLIDSGFCYNSPLDIICLLLTRNDARCLFNLPCAFSLLVIDRSFYADYENITMPI